MSRVDRRNFMRAAAGALAVAGLGASPAPRFDVRRFGATGNGSTPDTAALNHAIAAASQAGGGTVEVPAGTYLCDSIRLKSRVTLYLAAGATIVAASPGGFDLAESNAPWEAYQDYGHNHFCNSLIWGEHLHDVGIAGPGLIWGRGLSRGTLREGQFPAATVHGVANKTIALKDCRNVTLRDFSILAGGHFGILATGVDNLTIDRLTIDTNRDGMNLDCCRMVSVTRCRVNSPSDDGICLKSSYALGEGRPTEHVTIRDCYVTGGYQVGSFLDGTKKRLTIPGDRYWPMTGRIKLGTESAGGFRDVAIEDCVFENCRGVALETVDGGDLEDVGVRRIAMRDVNNAPFFLRLGARLDAPPGTKVGRLRRIVISDLTCHSPANTMPAMIVGIPGHPIEDVVIRDVHLEQRGGDAATIAATIPAEEEKLYPEPAFFGPIPAQGLFARHVRGLELDHVDFASAAPDARPVIWLGDVHGERFSRVTMPHGAATPIFHHLRPRTASL
jgi:polygalacturonase